METPFKTPVKLVIHRQRWQIYDRENKLVLMIMPMQGDRFYLADLQEKMEFIKDMINLTEEKPEEVIAVPETVDEKPEVVVVPKKRGRKPKVA